MNGKAVHVEFKVSRAGSRQSQSRSIPFCGDEYPPNGDAEYEKGTKSQYTSKPGEPPRKHSSALQKSIYFALDESKMSAVIGPVKFKGQSQGAKALESGGTVIKTETRFITPRQTRSGNRPYKPMSGRSAAEQRHIKDYYGNRKPVKKKVKINIKPRPFMVPALKKEIKNMAKNLQRARNKFKK